MLLSKAEVNVASQVPQGHSRPPAIGPKISTNIEWLTVTSSLHSWFYPEDLGKPPKRNAFKRRPCGFLSLFMLMCEISPSQSVLYVTYTVIKVMNSQKRKEF